MPRIKVIFNPAADRGHAREIAPQIKEWLSAKGDIGWAETSRPGEAVELAARILKGEKVPHRVVLMTEKITRDDQ